MRPHDREIITAWLQRINTAEIAAKLGIPESIVANRVARQLDLIKRRPRRRKCFAQPALAAA